MNFMVFVSDRKKWGLFTIHLCEKNLQLSLLISHTKSVSPFFKMFDYSLENHLYNTIANHLVKG